MVSKALVGAVHPKKEKGPSPASGGGARDEGIMAMLVASMGLDRDAIRKLLDKFPEHLKKVCLRRPTPAGARGKVAASTIPRPRSRRPSSSWPPSIPRERRVARATAEVVVVAAEARRAAARTAEARVRVRRSATTAVVVGAPEVAPGASSRPTTPSGSSAMTSCGGTASTVRTASSPTKRRSSSGAASVGGVRFHPPRAPA